MLTWWLASTRYDRRPREESATRYRCLILDHDDTAVDSSARVHHPAHVRSMEVLRPGVAPVDLDGWFVKNFDPGIMPFLVHELGLTPEELAVEHRIWREHTTRATPEFYPGFLEALAAFRSHGGFVTVVSHSESDVIRRHYRQAGHPEPDLVFGWDIEPEHRKPSPWAVHEIVRRLGISPQEVLVVDDLRPGIEMARAAGVDAAAAGWAHDIPVIRTWMQQACVAYFATVQEFASFVLA